MGASLVVGGVDLNGPQLYDVHPHGSYSRLPFTALGEPFHPFHTDPASATQPSRCVPQQLTADLRCPFPPAGSGQDAAVAVLEDRFRPNMTVSDFCPLLHAHWRGVPGKTLTKSKNKEG